ncbi:MAG: hypothetical protein KDB79_07805 [Acidobacteria bacterium]|nr:hypothetical protein [Acidobacteriota bacterium]
MGKSGANIGIQNGCCDRKLEFDRVAKEKCGGRTDRKRTLIDLENRCDLRLFCETL